MEKIIKRRIAYLTQVHRLCKVNDLPFEMLIQLNKQKADQKRLARKERHYGSFFDWQTAEMDTLGLLVNRCSKKDNEIINIKVFTTKDELPLSKHHLWL